MAETVASFSVPEHYVKMYTANVTAALNKKGGILLPYVDSKMDYMGEKSQIINFLGAVEFTERDNPFVDTKLVEIEHTQVWISGREFDCAILIDRLDTLKMIYDPTSPYVERFREAAARKQDEIIMSKFFATMKTGKDGTTDTAYATANTVAAGGTRFSVAKLRALRVLMKKKFVDLRSTTPFIAVTCDEINDLIGEVVVGSHDFNAVKPLVNGEVSDFMGFKFVPYEDNGVITATNGKGVPASGVTRTCPAWVMDGMHFGGWEGLTITINNRPDKNNIKQIHGTFTAGATRRENGKVFGIEVDTSVAVS